MDISRNQHGHIILLAFGTCQRLATIQTHQDMQFPLKTNGGKEMKVIDIK